jgi:hypothetical protein
VAGRQRAQPLRRSWKALNHKDIVDLYSVQWVRDMTLPTLQVIGRVEESKLSQELLVFEAVEEGDIRYGFVP